MCGIAKQYFIENGCWEEVKEVAYRHFYNCSFGMWLQTDEEFKKAHFDELHKLYKDIKTENVKLKYFKRNQKKVIKLIAENNYDKLRKNVSLYTCSPLVAFRRHFIQIRWNKKDKFIRVFGKVLVSK